MVNVTLIALAKSWSRRVVSHQLAFIVSCLTISHTCLLCLSSRWVSRCVSGVIKGSEDSMLV